MSDNEEIETPSLSEVAQKVDRLFEIVIKSTERGTKRDAPDDGHDDLEGVPSKMARTEPGEVRDEGGDDSDQLWVEQESDILDELVQELGEQKQAPPVSDALAKIIAARFSGGFTAEVHKEKVEKTARPSNCPDLAVPKVNQEIWDRLQIPQRKADWRIFGTQRGLVAAGAKVSRAVDALNTKHPDPHTKEIVRELVDALGLVGHAFKDLSVHRREVLRPVMAREYVSLCNASAKVSTPQLLFGEDLAKQQRDMASAA